VVQVTVRLLGEFGIDVDGRAVPDASLRRRDATALVKRLAIAPLRLLHREVLTDSLWPDVEPAAASNRLHKAGHFVRKATGVSTAIVNKGGRVALFPGADVRIDAMDLDAASADALARGDPGAAASVLARWHGELLPLDRYEDWAAGPRHRFARRHIDLLRLAGRHDEILALDPVDEAAHLAMMRAHLTAGDRRAALRQFRELERLLADELGLGPGPEAVALAATVRGDAGPDRSTVARDRSSPGPPRSRDQGRRPSRARPDRPRRRSSRVSSSRSGRSSPPPA
jgi:DNA-binding SARP family transcriptional activator